MSQQKQRNRSIRGAISGSLACKVGSAVLQFVSLPLAARVLGREEFGIYATVSMSLFAVSILQLGVGPALAKGISEASVASDRERESRFYLSGALLVLALAALGLSVVGVTLETVPLVVLFGERYSGWGEVMVPALWTGAFLMAAEVIVAHTDRVREGYMEASIAYNWGAVGNLAGAVAVFVGIRYQPSVSFLLMAVFVPNIVVRLINTALLLRKRPYLMSRGGLPDSSTLSELIRDGLSFSATTSVVYLVEFNVCALLVGRWLGPGQVAIHQVLMSITTAFTGLLVMVGTPVWAALMDARAKGDREWMISTSRNYYRFLAVISGGAALVLVILGPVIVRKWYGDEFTISRVVFAAHAFFLVAVGWRQVNRFLCIGLNQLKPTVSPIVVGVTASLLLGAAGLKIWGLWGLFAGLAAGTLLIPGWALPRIVWEELRCETAGNPARGVAPRPDPEEASPKRLSGLARARKSNTGIKGKSILEVES